MSTSIITAAVTAILTAASTMIVWTLQQYYTNKVGTNKALMYLLKRELKDMYKEINHEKGITIEEFREFDDIYQCYKKMGGNGTVEVLYNKLKQEVGNNGTDNNNPIEHDNSL